MLPLRMGAGKETHGDQAVTQAGQDTRQMLREEMEEANPEGLGLPLPLQVPDVRLLDRHLGPPEPHRGIP